MGRSTTLARGAALALAAPGSPPARAWVACRDAPCAFEGSRHAGGSMRPTAVDGCAEALTGRRTADLRKAPSCAKDGAGC